MDMSRPPKLMKMVMRVLESATSWYLKTLPCITYSY